VLKRCKTCYGWISSKATKCKHCNSPVDDKRKSGDDEFITYINSGFSLIEKECAMFEAKVDAMKGSVFPHHEHSEEDLMRSVHFNNIKSVAGKMGGDIAAWEAKGLLSEAVRIYYENKMNILRQKMNYMIERVKFRRKTAWDNLCELLLSSYYFIFNIAFYHFRNFVVPNMADPSSQSKSPFNVFGQAARFFENFMSDMTGNYERWESSNKKRA
jgi:hypothetical protein